MASIDNAGIVLGDDYFGEFSVKVDLGRGIDSQVVRIKHMSGNTFATLDADDARILASVLLGMADALDGK